MLPVLMIAPRVIALMAPITLLAPMKIIATGIKVMAIALLERKAEVATVTIVQRVVEV